MSKQDLAIRGMFESLKRNIGIFRMPINVKCDGIVFFCLSDSLHNCPARRYSDETHWPHNQIIKCL